MPVQWVRCTGSARDKADNCGSAARDKADNYVYSSRAERLSEASPLRTSLSSALSVVKVIDHLIRAVKVEAVERPAQCDSSSQQQ
ncbi:hypothetical protein J6590_041728 [Homalodisca vitripennis]|nr:hypothetical protein J6590_041728 [Homalodisca vitripennis]